MWSTLAEDCVWFGPLWAPAAVSVACRGEVSWLPASSQCQRAPSILWSWSAQSLFARFQELVEAERNASFMIMLLKFVWHCLGCECIQSCTNLLFRKSREFSKYVFKVILFYRGSLWFALALWTYLLSQTSYLVPFCHEPHQIRADM